MVVWSSLNLPCLFSPATAAAQDRDNLCVSVG